jgi:aspartate aminotransferase-like enzyme
MSERARTKIDETTSDIFAVDLKKWLSIMEAYEAGGHAYHATMPTDALKVFRDTMLETRDYGVDRLRDAQWRLGNGVRTMLALRGVNSVAAEGFGAPGVVVSYTDDAGLQNGSKFAAEGMQIAAGVPLQCEEPADFSTFRLGLFGLDKLYNTDATMAVLEEALDAVMPV